VKAALEAAQRLPYEIRAQIGSVSPREEEIDFTAYEEGYSFDSVGEGGEGYGY
jgi:hypothetical protein